MAVAITDNLIESMKELGFKNPEVAEITRDFFDYTGYPTPLKKFRLTYKSENYSVEEMYFWMVGHALEAQSMPYVQKITDMFAASQGSTIFGDLGQRLTQMQNQASNLLMTTNNMIKDLFKKVRDMRKLRERLSYYKKSDYVKSLEDRKKDIAHAAENTLKDLWITLVEGGGENPGSVYGMARKVDFVVLPDLFFQAPPLKDEEIKEFCTELDYNPAVKLALERKLYQFYIWKKGTYEELLFKETMLKKSIYQHYQNIKLYLNWIKPYIKNSQKLTMNNELMDTFGIISSFQTSMVEIEVLVHRPMDECKYSDEKTGDSKRSVVHAVVLLHFLYETSPEMNFHAKDSYQQKGPSHVGKVAATIRSYAWTDTDIANYKSLRVDEEVELMRAIDNSLVQDVDDFGGDLKQIINEIEKDLDIKLSGTQEKDDSEMTVEEKRKDFQDQIKKFRKEMGGPFSDILKGVKELVIDPFKSNKSDEKLAIYNNSVSAAKKSAAGTANLVAWQIYKNYKKAHKMVTW